MTTRTRWATTTALVLTSALVFGACSNEPEAFSPLLQLPESNGSKMAESTAASDMARWQHTTYELAPGNYPTGGPATAYTERANDVTIAQVATLAQVLGVAGEVRADQDGGFQVGANTGPAAVEPESVLTVDRKGGWWYSLYSVNYPEMVCNDAGCEEVDAEPAIDDATALTQATNVFEHGGLTTATQTVSHPYGNQTTVEARETLDGVQTGRVWHVSFVGAQLSWASGSFAALDKLGVYNTLDATEVALRFDDPRWSSGGWSPVSAWVETTPAVPERNASDTDSTASSGDDTTSYPPPAPDSRSRDQQPDIDQPMVSIDDLDKMPGLDGEKPTSNTVTFTKVEAVLTSWFIDEHTVYYLPAFRFSNDDYHELVVLSVADGAVSFTEPSTFDGGDIDPSGTSGGFTVPGEPADSEIGFGDGDGDGVDDWDAGVDADQFVGLSEPDAEQLAEQLDVVVRVRSRDGEPFMGTTDYRTDRVNVDIVDATVIAASVG
jgi:hypothetical protein